MVTRRKIIGPAVLSGRVAVNRYAVCTKCLHQTLLLGSINDSVYPTVSISLGPASSPLIRSDLSVSLGRSSDELPVQLTLPRAMREAKNRQQLSSLALLGQEFWRYPMANPKPPESSSSNTSSLSSFRGGEFRSNQIYSIYLDRVISLEDKAK